MFLKRSTHGRMLKQIYDRSHFYASRTQSFHPAMLQSELPSTHSLNLPHKTKMLVDSTHTTRHLHSHHDAFHDHAFFSSFLHD